MKVKCLRTHEETTTSYDIRPNPGMCNTSKCIICALCALTVFLITGRERLLGLSLLVVRPYLAFAIAPSTKRKAGWSGEENYDTLVVPEAALVYYGI